MNNINNKKLNQDRLFEYLILVCIVVLLFILVYGVVLSDSLQDMNVFIGTIVSLIVSMIIAYSRWRLLATLLLVVSSNPDIIDKDTLIKAMKLTQKSTNDKKDDR